MKRFSERYGFKSVKSVIQIDSMDDELRNSLWNVLHGYFFGKGERVRRVRASTPTCDLVRVLWRDFFKRPMDEILDVHLGNAVDSVKHNFFNWEWYEVYDFLEFVAASRPRSTFPRGCNRILERELSGYRFVGNEIVRLTSLEEVAEIEEALESPEPLAPAAAHLQRALELLSDRKAPDYRNSIKESISAVEAICCLLAESPKTTLGQALKALEAKIDLHPALKDAFSALYGYTSDADGIRHALLDEPNLDFEDAKFMLVSCSAFVNYLKSKASKAGLL